MWFGKFLDIKDQVEAENSEFKKKLFADIKKDKLTPLEFSILENIFNHEEISGYDLIHYLNEHFAGTWEAKSGTIYPILSKLKVQGFLKTRTVKSPIGPLKKLYQLTEAGKVILKGKVKKHFFDQIKFMENYLNELISIYIHSFLEEEHKDKISEVQDLIEKSFERIIKNIPLTVAFKETCPKCKNEIERKVAFCPHCGEPMYSDKSERSHVENEREVKT